MDESVCLRDLTHYCVLSEGGINYKFRTGAKRTYIKRARTINSNLRRAYELCILHVITFIEGGMSC